jgi:DnaJ-class molecular chaperone
MNDPRVTFDDARAAKIKEDERCPKCEGTGNEFLFMYRMCSDCKGTGVKQNVQPQEDVLP